MSQDINHVPPTGNFGEKQSAPKKKVGYGLHEPGKQAPAPRKESEHKRKGTSEGLPKKG